MKEAHYYYSKACSLKHPLSCYTLAQTYTKGKVVEKNLDKAMKAYEIACDGEIGEIIVTKGKNVANKELLLTIK